MCPQGEVRVSRTGLVPGAEPMARRAPLQVVDPTGYEEWDKLIGTHPGASFFHGAAWANVLRDTYQHVPFYIVVEDAGSVLGLLPLMEVSSVLTGRRGVALPFADECPTLESGMVTRRELFEKAVEIGRRQEWKYVECRGSQAFFGDADPSVSFYTHTLDLTRGDKDLFAGLDSAARRAIRKAQHEGLRFEVARNLDGMRIFYRLHCGTRRKHGLPPQSFPFFRAILGRIIEQDAGFIGIVSLGAEPLAALLFFYHGKRAIYKFGASDENHLNLRANNLAMWEGIRWLAEHGIGELNFGRTSIANEGLRRYKMGWGVTERRLDYWRYDLRKSAFVVAHDRAEGWHNRVFRSLPLPVNRWLGAALYRHLS